MYKKYGCLYADKYNFDIFDSSIDSTAASDDLPNNSNSWTATWPLA